MHDLYIIFKDQSNDKTKLKPYLDLLSESEVSYYPIYLEGGLDIDAYYYAAVNIEKGYLLFLNTSSVILGTDWLRKYRAAFNTNNVGMVSATASNQSYYSSVFQNNTWQWESQKGFIFNFRKYKLLIKALCYWRFLFKPFPNPHLRTNAFMINSEVFLSIHHKLMKSKLQAYQFESGRKSISKILLKKGFTLFVLDKDGRAYDLPNWKNSSTFWINNQENLLVSDNQTRLYKEADPETRKSITKLAWGV